MFSVKFRKVIDRCIQTQFTIIPALSGYFCLWKLFKLFLITIFCCSSSPDPMLQSSELCALGYVHQMSVMSDFLWPKNCHGYWAFLCPPNFTAEILGRLPISYSKGSFQSRDLKPASPVSAAVQVVLLLDTWARLKGKTVVDELYEHYEYWSKLHLYFIVSCSTTE